MSRNPFANISLPFTNVSSTLTQAPTTANNHTAVATSSVETQGLSITEFGVANPASAGTDDTKTIIEAARLESQQRVIFLAGQIAQQLPVSSPKPMRDITPEGSVFDGGRRPLPKGISLGNGGGDRPASLKQRQLIEGICQQRGITPDQLCNDLCNRPLVELRGQDAHKVIQTLNLKARH